MELLPSALLVVLRMLIMHWQQAMVRMLLSKTAQLLAIRLQLMKQARLRLVMMLEMHIIRLQLGHKKRRNKMENIMMLTIRKSLKLNTML